VLLTARLLRIGDRGSGRHCLVVEGLAVGVDGWAVGGPAYVVPDRRAVRPRGCRVDVVAQELGCQVVLAAASRVTTGASVHRAEGTHGATGNVRVLHHADEVP